MLSGYRLMWMMVMFDLPVVTAEERKSATEFRHFLQDEGFEMVQYSVYVRFCSGPERVQALMRRVEQALPAGGRVDILTFTDKQYENIVSFTAGRPGPSRKNPEQFELF